MHFREPRGPDKCGALETLVGCIPYLELTRSVSIYLYINMSIYLYIYNIYEYIYIHTYIHIHCEQMVTCMSGMSRLRGVKALHQSTKKLAFLYCPDKLFSGFISRTYKEVCYGTITQTLNCTLNPAPKFPEDT